MEDIDGKRTIDAVGGLWNVNLGYSCEAIKKAIALQLEELPYYSAFKGTTTPKLIELSEKLTEILQPEEMKRFFFTLGGSDSVETSLRLTRQYWKIRGQKDRFKFISFQKAYHGTHFGGASVNGNDRFRRFYEPLMPGCYHIPFPNVYRNPFNIDDPEKLNEYCLALLENQIVFQGADTVAAIIAEPVLGAGGVYVPTAKLWPGLRRICDKYDILLIADEVITGFGRTGSWFGSRLWGVKPDMVCLAKGISSGYFPMGAVGINSKIAEVFMKSVPDEGSIFHGYTYSGHPVGCAASLAALEETFARNLAGNSKVQGEFMLKQLSRLKEKFSIIGDVRGQGLMMALEIVSDLETKTPAAPEIMSKLLDYAYEAGALIRVAGNNLLLSPPLILERSQAETIVSALEDAFEKNSA